MLRIPCRRSFWTRFRATKACATGVVLRAVICGGGLPAPPPAPRVDHGVIAPDELIPGLPVGGKLLAAFEEGERGLSLVMGRHGRPSGTGAVPRRPESQDR